MQDPLTVTIQVIQAVAVLVLGVGIIFLARVIRRIRRSLDKVDTALGTIAKDARPVFDRARAVGENLNFIVMSVRKEVDRAGATMSRANDQLERALEVAEERVQELSALIDVVQGEVEETLLTATSALKGIRAGAKVLASQSQRNDEESSDVEDQDD